MSIKTVILFSSIIVTVLLVADQNGMGQQPEYPKARVSFQDFKGLVVEVEKHRAARLIDLNTFHEMSKQEGVVILDTRSKFRYDRIHVKGALHLNFSDFTQANLAKVIPSFDTTVLIYCNNNFDGNPVDFASKVVVTPTSMRSLSPNTSTTVTPRQQFKDQEKPLMMALNVPTYINLYGYGYRNVYELHELVKVTDPRITFEGSIVK